MKKVIGFIGIFLTAATAFASGYDYTSPYSNNVDPLAKYGYSTPANYGFGTNYGPDNYNYNGNVDTGYTSRFADAQYCAPALSLTLTVGSQNTEVLTLQDYLHDQGYLLASPNGYFGSGTKAAVIRFQRDNDVTANGIVNGTTRDLLNDHICGDGSYALGSHVDKSSGAYFGNAYNFNKLPAISDTVIIPTTHVTSFDTYHSQTTNSQYSTSFAGSVSPITSNQLPTAQFTNTTPVTNGNIAYYPYDPFGKSPLPLPATLSINPPLPNSVYKEGDTMTVAWGITNANVSHYVLTLDNTSTSLTRTIAVVPGNQTSASFVLSKDLLDLVCGGICDTAVQKNFRLTLKATLSQQYQDTSILTARVENIVILRPYVQQALTLTPSKTPVNSGDTINLYVSVPSGSPIFAQYNSILWKVRALCPANFGIIVNGQACGTDNYVYQQTLTSSPNITATIINTSWGPQQVTFEATAYSAYGGTVLGTASTTVVVNR